MSDAVTAAPAPAKKAAKPRKTSKSADHPKYNVMIAAAIGVSKERGGSSRQAILKYILANYKVGNEAIKVNGRLKTSLKAGVLAGTLKQAKGTGASGSFRLGEKKVVVKPKVKAKKPAAKKPKSPAKKPKAAAKKPKSPAKKPKAAAKKPKSPAQKAAAKKPKSPKKASCQEGCEAQKSGKVSCQKGSSQEARKEVNLLAVAFLPFYGPPWDPTSSQVGRVALGTMCKRLALLNSSAFFRLSLFTNTSSAHLVLMSLSFSQSHF